MVVAMERGPLTDSYIYGMLSSQPARSTMFDWLLSLFSSNTPVASARRQTTRARTAAEVRRPVRTRAEAWAAVEATNLDRVVEALVTREGWEKKRAVKAVGSYRQFLYLIMRHPGRTLVPWTLDLDAAWHAHLLDSQRYADDTIRLFGGFLHHNPDLPRGSPEQRDGLDVTRELHRTEFDSIDEPHVRPVDDRSQRIREERPQATNRQSDTSSGCGSAPLIACSTVSSSPSHGGSHDASPGHANGHHGGHDPGASCGAPGSGSDGSSCGGGASCGGGGCGGGGD